MKHYLVIGTFILLGLLVLWLLLANNQTVKSLARISVRSIIEQDKTRRLAIKDMRRAFSARIAFYGKVVDEKNNPISGASVQYSVADKLPDGTQYEGTSDINGCFSITGIKGADMTVGVSKPGYYIIRDQSSGYFAYGVPNTMEIQHPIPTKDSPAVFVLRKMGETVSLVVAGIKVRMPKDGTPVEISLSTGTEVPEGEGDIIVECWTKNEGLDPNLNEHYDWRFRLTIPDGGLAERKDEFDFIAPESGYRPMIEFNMPKDASEWKNRFEDEYFLKLRGNRYARMEFRMISGGAHFAVVTSYLNPTPGVRNLEYDPEKAIKPHR